MVPQRPSFMGHARLGAVEPLDWHLFIDGQHDGMGWRIDIETDDLVQFGANCGGTSSGGDRAEPAAGVGSSRHEDAICAAVTRWF